MLYTIPLVSFDRDFAAVPVRTVTVEAPDAFEAAMLACDLIAADEADHVFATMPSS